MTPISFSFAHHNFTPYLRRAELGQKAHGGSNVRRAVKGVDDAVDMVERKGVQDGVRWAPLPCLDQALDLSMEAPALK